MKKPKIGLSKFIGVVIALVISSAAWAACCHYDNRLNPWGDYGTETVNVNDVYVKFVNGKTRRGVTADSSYTVESLTSSVFNLKSDNGYAGVGSFNGYMIINMDASSRGVIRSGSSFGIYSQDARFGTGHEADYNCNNAGNNCTSGQLVYGGEISAFGWSGTEGIIEFEITNLAGWAIDNWNPGSLAVEHILVRVPPYNVSNELFGSTFTTTGDSFAVVVNTAQ